MIPLYLQQPDAGARTHGRLTYEVGYYWLRELTPAVREFAKRVFPGCARHSRSTDLKFRGTKRMVGDLNWLMLRYPMEVECEDQFFDDRDRALDHAERREKNQDLGEAAIPPTFTGELYPFQSEGVSFMLANERSLLADSMGLGKTVTCLAALATAVAFPALIVVPASVQLQWQSQAAHFLDLPQKNLVKDPSPDATAVILKGLKPYDLPERSIYICHYGLLRGWYEHIQELGLKAIVFDEIQDLRHPTTKKYSKASLIAGEVDFCWGLSGTPIHNYGDEIWSVTNILDYHCLGDRESFTREWCVGYNQRIVDKPEALRDHLKREGLLLRRRKSEVQAQLPPKRRVVTTIDKDDDVYNTMIAKAVSIAQNYDAIKEWNEKGQARREIEQGARQATGISKAPYAGEFVASLLDAGEKVLVYSWHHAVHDTIADVLSKRRHASTRATGKQNPAMRAKAISDFIDGDFDAILLSLRTAAGLDGLQGRGTCVVFAELDWSPAVHAQCEDRLHRMGVQELDSILIYYLISDAGYDRVMQERLGLKIGQFIGIMGDEWETEEDRVLANEAATKHLDKVIDLLKEHRA